MRGLQEIDIRLNKLEYTARANVTTSAQNLEEIFTGINDSAKDNLKTVIVTNTAADIVYFGSDDTVTTSTGGGLLRGYESREFVLKDITASPYFIAGQNTEIGIELWS